MRRSFRTAISTFLFLFACESVSDPNIANAKSSAESTDVEVQGFPPSAVEGDKGVAVFAGGCFWCVESEFDDVAGVQSAVSGYTGGSEQNPTYGKVSSKLTGHAEAVRVVYDPNVVTYAELLDLFWRNIDPFQANGQFCDLGKPYRSGVFFQDETQKALAESTRDEVAARFGKDVVTEVTQGETFWLAEEYHQDFHRKNPAHYQRYRKGCGRDRRLTELWGDNEH